MTVAVLMSTYNGQQYLKDQINSIINQKNVNVELYVRDDGSHDSTFKILCEYEKNYSNIVIVNNGNLENIGIGDSFFTLLEYGFKKSSAEYFAFSDQDDVWLSEKLENAIHFIDKSVVNPKGRLYYSNKTFVNENLDVMSQENIPFYNDYLEVFWKNRASGCTMVFDRHMAALLMKSSHKVDTYHDGRLYRIAKSVGSTILFDKQSYILYRIHAFNTVGMQGTEQYHESLLYWAKRFLPKFFEKRRYNLLYLMDEIIIDYNDDLTEDAKNILSDYMSYRTNLKSKIKLISDHRMKKRTRKDRIIWAYRILFNWL